MKNFFSLFLILSIKFVVGQTKSLTILDSVSKKPISNVIVESYDSKYQELTNENGHINLIKFPKKIIAVRVHAIGYQSRSIQLNISKNQLIYLNPKTLSISEVLIRSSSTKNIFKTLSDIDIHLKPIQNSQEVLRMVPGLFIGQHAGGGKAEQIFLRGFDLDHGTDINISVDGIPVNMVSHAHGQGYADLHFLIPESIEAVTFNKGPYFADKGNFMTAGFVEFRTKQSLEKNFLKIEGAQFQTYRGVLGLNLINDSKDHNQDLYFLGEGQLSNGYFDNSQDFNRLNGLLKYRKNLNSNNSIQISLSGFRSKWNASGQIPSRAVQEGIVGFYGAIDNTEGGTTSRYNANIEWLNETKNGSRFGNQIYYTNNAFELYSNFTFFKVDTMNGDQIRQKENRSILGYNGTFQREFNIGKASSELKAGIQSRYDIIDDIELTRTKNRTINTNEIMFGMIEELNVGTYISNKLGIGKKLDITATIRFDYFFNKYDDRLQLKNISENSSIISPKLNIDYKVNNRIHLYVYNGTGFHSNDTRVITTENKKEVLPRAFGTDIGGVFKLGNKLFIQSAFWQLWLDQEFVYVGDEGVVEAGGQSQRFGWDISTRYEIVKNLFADIDFNISNPKALGLPSSENNIPLAPKLTSAGGITYKKKSGINGSLRYRYMGDRPANESNSVIANGYFLLDAVVNYKVKNWELGISVLNLLNTQWKETQFDTESRLKNESNPISEIHFTPGTPFFAKCSFTMSF